MNPFHDYVRIIYQGSVVDSTINGRNMERDIAYFVSWCIEEYKSIIGLGGTATMELLDKYDILQYLANNFDVLHTQSRQWLMEEITEKIEQGKKAEKA